jgi:hypothetical protein
MLFSQANLTGLFCFENRQIIFECVDSRFKFVILTFEKINKLFPFLWSLCVTILRNYNVFSIKIVE